MAEVLRELIFRLLLTTCRKVEILHNFILRMRAVAHRKLLILLRLWKWGEGSSATSTVQDLTDVSPMEVGRRKKEEDLVPVLLVDEDTAATNFMIRDRRMQELIAKDKEPITPFIDKVKLLYADCGVSTILVMGGSGDYFDVADTVIAMKDRKSV